MALRRTPVTALFGLAVLVGLPGCTQERTSPAAGAPNVAASAAASAAAPPSRPRSSPAASPPAGEGPVAGAARSFAGSLWDPGTTAAALPDRAKVAMPSRALRLSGLTVVLDPGHNGGNAASPARLNAPVPAGGFTKACNTTGAQTNAGYAEHAFTWDVVARAAALLRAQGATVVLTRHSDSGFGPCVNVRAAIGNAAHADAVVAVHADGASAAGYGFHVIAPAVAPDGGNASILARSWALALAVRSAFHTVSGEPFSSYVSGGLARRSDLAGLNLSRVPAIFIECANLRNAGDASRVTSPAWRQRAAAGIVAGVAAFLRR